MEKYKTIRALGAGAFGEVHLAENLETKQMVAIKSMKQKYATWDECLQLREVKSLLKLKNPNIIALKEVLHIQHQLHLIFEYAQTNLYDEFLKDNTKLGPSEFTIKSIIKKIAEGLAYTHKMGFFHRDLKPQNILYNPRFKNIKICDFGLARQVRSAPPYTQYVSTRWYRAPQLILRMNAYNSPVDIFALGCIMAELISGKPLFPGASESDQLLKVFRVLGTPNQIDWPELYKWAKQKNITIPELQGQGLQKYVKIENPLGMQLLKSMLQVSPKNRITAQGIVNHAYLQDTEANFKENDYQIKKFRRRGVKAKQMGQGEVQKSGIRNSNNHDLKTEEQEIFLREESNIKQVDHKEKQYLNELSIKINNQNVKTEQNQKSMQISAIIREIEGREVKRKSILKIQESKEKMQKMQKIEKIEKVEKMEKSESGGSTHQFHSINKQIASNNKILDERKSGFQDYFPSLKYSEKQIRDGRDLKQIRSRKLIHVKDTNRKEVVSLSPQQQKNLQFLKYKFIPKQLPTLVISPSQGNLRKGTILPILTPRK